MIRRAANRWRRFSVEHFARRDFRLPGDVAYVSFTFDDFPRTALTEGGRILRDHGVRGTYFVSFQLLDTDSVSGRIVSLDDLHRTLRDGHELGCHTFSHVDGSVVAADEFARSIDANRAALASSPLETHFDTFAYPLNGPAVPTKKVAGGRFIGCRGGGQTFNADVIDLSLLKAYFLDARSRPRMAEVTQLIARNADNKGWLIFASHDVRTTPSDYGWNPTDFAHIVNLSLRSGAHVLPMKDVCAALGLARRGVAAASPR